MTNRVAHGYGAKPLPQAHWKGQSLRGTSEMVERRCTVSASASVGSSASLSRRCICAFSRLPDRKAADAKSSATFDFADASLDKGFENIPFSGTPTSPAVNGHAPETLTVH